jgi:hypothetical protein
MENTNDNIVNPTNPVTPVTEPVTTPTPPVEPTTPTTPTEPTTPQTPPTKPQEPTPTINTDEIKEEVSKGVIQKIGEALGLTKKEEAKLPTDPKELEKLVEDRSKKTVQEILDERDTKAKEEEEAHEKEVQEGAKRYQNLWASQYDQLATAGKLPKIEDINDVNDPGRQAKAKLLTKLYEVLQENEKNGIDEVPTLKEIYYDYPEVLTNKVAGATTPVSGGGRTHSSGNAMDYNDIHNSSFEDILKENQN